MSDIIGWRCWDLITSASTGNIRLLGAHGKLLPMGSDHAATCTARATYHDRISLLREDRELLPEEALCRAHLRAMSHACGYYGYYALPELWDGGYFTSAVKPHAGKLSADTRTIEVIGRVRPYGEVLVAEKGFRASNILIEQLTIFVPTLLRMDDDSYVDLEDRVLLPHLRGAAVPGNLYDMPVVVRDYVPADQSWASYETIAAALQKQYDCAVRIVRTPKQWLDFFSSGA